MPSRTSSVRLSPRRRLQHVDHPQRVLVVAEAAAEALAQAARRGTSSPMWPNGGCPRSCPRPDRLDQVLVEAQRPRDGPRDLRDLQRVGQAGAVVVALGGDEDLGLVLEAPEGLASARCGRGRAGAACAARSPPPRGPAPAGRTGPPPGEGLRLPRPAPVRVGAGHGAGVCVRVHPCIVPSAADGHLAAHPRHGGGRGRHGRVRLSARRGVLVADRGLRGRDPRDRHAVGRAGDVVDARVVEEVDRVRVAAVLAADAELQVRRLALRPSQAPIRSSWPTPGRVERLERRAVEDLRVDVAGEDACPRCRRARSRAPSGSGRWCRTRRSRRCSAMRSARKHARGSSIIVPTR